MKLSLVFYLLIFSLSLHAQKYSGTWQGGCFVADPSNPTSVSSSWFYLEMNIVKGIIDGKIRHESSLIDQYCLFDITGKIQENGQIEITETRLSKHSKNAQIPNKQQFLFEYDAAKGYLLGKSTDGSATITLYKAAFNISENTVHILPVHQLEQFQQDLKDGLSSPEKRKEELLSFQFKPIYFDYDKDLIKKEYEAYLLEMIRMVKSHSDLRILITGHTDSDGSDAYNIDLSKRRAAALEQFFESNGLQKSRVEIDFKGEKEPVDKNDTDSGKQKNRRVDFSFI